MKRLKKRYWAIGLALVALSLFLLLSTSIVTARPFPLKVSLPSPAKKVDKASQTSASAWEKVEALARREGYLTIYSWSWTEKSAAPIIKQFEERYGVRVGVVAGRGPEFMERLKAEFRTGSRVGDLVEGSPIHLTNMKIAGLTTSALGLPVLQEKGVWAYQPTQLDSAGHVIAYAPYILSPYINTRLVSPGQEPRSWADLLIPAWKGRMVMPHPETSAVPYYLGLLIRHKALPPDYHTRLGRQEILLSGRTPDSGELLGWGEASLSVLNAAPDMVPPWKDGGPIKAINMREGLLLNSLTMALVKGSLHPNAAQLFLKWLLTDEGQRSHSQAKLTVSIRKGVKQATPLPFRLESAKLVTISQADSEFVAKQFAEKAYVPYFMVSPK